MKRPADDSTNNENGESLEEAWLSDMDSDVEGHVESGTVSTENL